MSIQKTIGGERLGSGKKMKQAMHNYERSNHDLSYIWRSTMTCGTLVPFINNVMLPGDTFDLNLEAEVLTHPTVGPLFGSFKMQVDVFQVPIRLYQAQLHNNKLGIGMNMSKIKLPQISLECNTLDWEEINEPIDIQQISPSSLLAYLGIRGVGDSKGNTVRANFNAIPYLAYWDIYKNYYANKQEEIGAFINRGEGVARNLISLVRWEESQGNFRTLYTGEPTSNAILQNIYGTEEQPWLNRPNNSIEIEGQDIDLDVLYVECNTIPEGKTSAYFPIKEWIPDLDYEPMIGAYKGLTASLYEKGSNTEQVKIVKIYGLKGIGRTRIETFPLENIDNMREDILEAIKNTEPFTIDQGTYAPYGDSLITDVVPINDKFHMRSYWDMQGLALKTYQSDLFNNWLSSEWIEGVNGIAEVSAIDVSDGSLRMDALNLAQKVYNMLNRIAISGGSYYDWIEAVYTQEAYKIAETPVYCGGYSKEVVFQEVVSNSATEEEPLGSLAGKGVTGGKEKGYVVINSSNEPCYAIGIVSLTPRIDYSQGNEWHTNLKTMDDLHKPELDGIGFQDLVTEQMAAWDVMREDDGTPTYKSAGKLPAWINYMTDVNKCYGLFADSRNEMFMTLNRNYETDSRNKTIKDLTTYIHPDKYNYAFANVALEAQNFWVQISVDINARRKVSAKQIPNL